MGNISVDEIMLVGIELVGVFKRCGFQQTLNPPLCAISFSEATIFFNETLIWATVGGSFCLANAALTACLETPFEEPLTFKSATMVAIAAYEAPGMIGIGFGFWFWGEGEGKRLLS
jgi:hypothetical protein